MALNSSPKKIHRMTTLRALHLLHGFTARGDMGEHEVEARVRTAVGDVLYDEIRGHIIEGRYPAVGSDQWAAWYPRAVVALREGHDAPTLEGDR